MQQTFTSESDLNVLIVDDNKDAAESLAFALQLEGRTVRFAISGFEALELLNDFVPHVALLDICMPDIDGHGLARTLRSRFNDAIVLIAVTGSGHPSDAFSAAFATFDHHLMKPIGLADFERLLPPA